jgi:hypothetical protein
MKATMGDNLMQHVDKTTFFKSAEDLGLTDPQYEALLDVRQQMLDDRINSSNFSYAIWPTYGYDGGGCIGYHAEKILRWPYGDPKLVIRNVRNPKLDGLFYHGKLTMSVQDALAGLENFLTTGDPLWG